MTVAVSVYTSPSNVCAFIFQGPAGAKGDKGERVSHCVWTMCSATAVQIWFYFFFSPMLNNPFFLNPLSPFQVYLLHNHALHFFSLFRANLIKSVLQMCSRAGCVFSADTVASPPGI